MSAFIGSGVAAELIHLPCQLMSEDGEVKKAVVITCAVTNKLREKMLMKTSYLKRLRDGEGVFGRSSPCSEIPLSTVGLTWRRYLMRRSVMCGRIASQICEWRVRFASGESDLRVASRFLVISSETLVFYAT